MPSTNRNGITRAKPLCLTFRCTLSGGVEEIEVALA
jgi:hypothetical protein